jgi:hypothetical protein
MTKLIVAFRSFANAPKNGGIVKWRNPAGPEILVKDELAERLWRLEMVGKKERGSEYRRR